MVSLKALLVKSDYTYIEIEFKVKPEVNDLNRNIETDQNFQKS